MNYSIIFILILVIIPIFIFSTCRTRSPYDPSKKPAKGYTKINTLLQTEDQKCNEFYNIVNQNLFLHEKDSCKQYNYKYGPNIFRPFCFRGLSKAEITQLLGYRSSEREGNFYYIFSTNCNAVGIIKTNETYIFSFKNDTVSDFNIIYNGSSSN